MPHTYDNYLNVSSISVSIRTPKIVFGVLSVDLLRHHIDLKRDDLNLHLIRQVSYVEMCPS